MDKKDINNERLIIQGLPDDQLDALVNSNQLSAVTANNIKAQRAGDTLRAEQAAAEEQARAERVAAIPDERVQANMNAIEDIAMQGTGVQPGHAPIIKAPPQAPSLNPVPAAPIVPKPAPALASQAPVSTPAPEVQAAANAEAEQQVATQNSQAKIANELQAKAVNEEQKAVNDVEEKAKEDDDKVAADLAKDSSWGDTIKQAVAIMMGAYSQGLTGAKSNPVLDLIEKRLEAKAKAEQWTAEQKVKALEQTQKAAKHEAEMQKSKTDSIIAKQNIEKNLIELDKSLADTEMAKMALANAQVVKNLSTKKQWTEADRVQIPNTQEGQELRERLVTIGVDKDGNIMSAPAYTRAGATHLTKDVLPAIANSQNTLKELVNLNEYFGNNVAKKIFSRSEIAKSQGKQQMLVGSLRLELFGPGVLTDTEQELARNIIRDPSKIATLSSANEAALLSLLDKLTISKNNQLRQNGIEVPKSVNEINIEKIRAQAPKLQTHQIIDILKKPINGKARWVYGE